MRQAPGQLEGPQDPGWITLKRREGVTVVEHDPLQSAALHPQAQRKGNNQGTAIGTAMTLG